jgi:hypothetical protein
MRIARVRQEGAPELFGESSFCYFGNPHVLTGLDDEIATRRHSEER